MKHIYTIHYWRSCKDGQFILSIQKEYLTPSAMLYLYKSQIKPKMDSRLQLHSPHFSALIEFKIIYAVLWGMTYSTFCNKAPCFQHLLGLKLTPDLKWNLYSNLLSKMLEKWWIHSIAPESIQVLIYYIFKKARSGKKKKKKSTIG